ncbi:MAG: TonB-dependent receptor [Pseudomonadota bacterium]
MGVKPRAFAFTASAVMLSGTASAQAVLEEIVVTAQKRAESIQDVPISITAFSGDFLEENGLQLIEDVARLTPNFTIQSSAQATNNRIVIRGIGSVGNSGIEPSVGVYIDGVYYPRPGSVIGLLTDIDSFEVLRGPQGTLFGRNTPIGALNIRTRNPSDETEIQLEAGAGNFNSYVLGATLNGALSDRLAGRFSVRYADRDGYGENTFDGEDFGERDDLVARAKLLYDISDRTSAMLTLDYSEINAGGQGIEVLNDTLTPTFLGTLNALYGDTPQTSDSFDWTINQDHDDQLTDQQYGLSLDISHELSNGLTLRSITAYRDWEALNANIDVRLATDLLPASTLFETDTFSQELQLTSKGGETVDWLVGAFFYDENYTVFEARSAGSALCIPTIAAAFGAQLGTVCANSQQVDALQANFDQGLQSVAAFGQATWSISDTFSATFGLRWTNDEKEADYTNEVFNPVLAGIRQPESTLGLVRDDSRVTWLANASWMASDETMLFATISTGYKSGGFNSQPTATPLGPERRVFAPEDTTNYEVGVKSTLLEGRMTANASIYRTDMDDFQDRAFDGVSFVTLNAGELRHQGLEADVNWLATDNLRLVLGLAYLDSEYTDFRNAPGLPGGAPQDLTGARRLFSPEWQGSLAADYSIPISGSLEAFAGASVSWIDEQIVGATSNDNPQTIQGSYALLNARLGIRSADNTWDVTLFGYNLGDEGYCQVIFDQAFGAQLGAVDPVNNTSVQRCALGAPRTWNVLATYRF